MMMIKLVGPYSLFRKFANFFFFNSLQIRCATNPKQFWYRDANGAVNPISRGRFSTPNSTVLMGYETFPTIEGGFGLTYLTRIPQLDPDPRNSLALSSKPQWFIHVT